ncbi:DNA-binding Lrp family transcriptional regulator [Kibdelosporangium banguiense]|uniref:DNA-binding Lrp family transcriptional regulator n=1 Tax=Kibdelosporangium banguiense TaxID=1365924 RepID=A0ABS4TDN1_9PSEU|nr:AsnC family transcriptional regulator [Kibdelosporangium banguiense]MBP2322529.1 DNA-binding Lrp family transcriptional regulator [Kibdelosporangium banguiense]
MEIDEIDRALIHALEIDGRAPFSKIADVLGISDQTVARRYRRLRATMAARVVGQTAPWRVGHVRWHVRIKCEPSTSLAVATALARRPDTYWVQMFSGGTEIDCVTESRNPEEPDTLLLQQLPRTPRVTDVSAHSILHVYFNERDYQALLDSLTPEQIDALRFRRSISNEPVILDAADYRMLAALELDGRASHAELAKVTGWSESTVRRRMDYLRETGALYYDVDIDTAALGFKLQARMWISVPPSELATAGEALTAHREIAFAAATTGTANLLTSVVCKDVPAFYEYLTTKVAALSAIEHMETSPVIRTIKRGATLITQ